MESRYGTLAGMKLVLLFLPLFLLAEHPVVQAAGTPAQKCAAAKIMAAGKQFAARAKCRAKAAGVGAAVDPVCLQKADDKFAVAFAKAEAKGGCGTVADAGPIGTDVGQCVGDVADDLVVACGNGRVNVGEGCDDGNLTAGDGCSATCTIEGGYQCTAAPSVCVSSCGNGQIDAGEACDGAALNGQTCVGLGYASGSLACRNDCTAFDESACVACDPQNCAEVGATCGPAGDGCGGTQNCGVCNQPQFCGGGGIPSQCGGSCAPMTCPTIGAVCGQHPNGCGQVLECGACPSGQSCMGFPAQCVATSTCTPVSAAVACGGRTCGSVSNGCGGLLSCGSCPAGQGCTFAGTCSTTGVCIPKTCAQLASAAGTSACSASASPAPGCFCSFVADGCGGLLDCGACASGEICGSAAPNVCGQ